MSPSVRGWRLLAGSVARSSNGRDTARAVR
jgi:hypothetical protein